MISSYYAHLPVMVCIVYALMLTLHSYTNTCTITPHTAHTDDSFAVAYSVCLFAFIVELLSYSWTRTEIESLYPPRIKGYLFSFFWWLDVVAIMSLFPDIKFIGKPMSIYGITTNVGSGANYGKAGRVVRLVRLVR